MKMRQWSLPRTTDGVLVAEDFELREVELDPSLAPGQVLLRTRYLSLDPYLTMQMRAGPVGPCSGRVIGEVEASRDPRLPVGTIAWGVGSWQEANVLPGDTLTVIPQDGLSPTVSLGAVGRSGLTAWVGLHLGGLTAGETVIVSAATGPVGSVATQLARRRGARAIGIAGGAEKCRLAVEAYGCDICLDHRDPDLEARIAQAAPDGADLVFENVGAPTLDAALPSVRSRGRIMLCGLVAHYNDPSPIALRNFRLLLLRHLTMQGFATSDYPELFEPGEAELRSLALAGTLQWRETIIDGFEAAPAAFLAMLTGDGVGKRLVKV